MMFRFSLFIFLIFQTDAAPTEKRQIKTGIVPIFNNRLTVEPITFTFTTPIARTFPTLLPLQVAYNEQTPTTSSQNYKFKAMQTSMQQMDLQQNAWATYRTLWKSLGDTWSKMQTDISSSNQIHQDWRQFWRDFAQTIDPYVNTLSTQFTSLFNVFLKHQQE